MILKEINVGTSCRDMYHNCEAIFNTTSAEINQLRYKFGCDFDAIPSTRLQAHLAKNMEMKVIFNPPATILIVGDKKFVSKVHNEEFDEEKGLLMCLAKANGITHLKLKRILKHAKRPKERANNENN
ncbi:MAG: hypothetical protein ACI4MS_03265 [Candidatus Coproplasma sp.]